MLLRHEESVRVQAIRLVELNLDKLVLDAVEQSSRPKADNRNCPPSIDLEHSSSRSELDQTEKAQRGFEGWEGIAGEDEGGGSNGEAEDEGG